MGSVESFIPGSPVALDTKATNYTFVRRGQFRRGPRNDFSDRGGSAIAAPQNIRRAWLFDAKQRCCGKHFCKLSNFTNDIGCGFLDEAVAASQSDNASEGGSVQDGEAALFGQRIEAANDDQPP
jgi:hypothetical protein